MTGLAADRGAGVTVAAMQPYLFPYLGYFQLIAHADVFVIGDDYPWVRAGWINRNRLMERGRARMFTLPVAAAPAQAPINERKLTAQYPAERRRLLSRLHHAYAHAPQSREVLPLVEQWLPAEATELMTVLRSAIEGVCGHLGIRTPRRLSSERPDRDHRGSTRVIRLVQSFGGTRFLNPPGGRAIYRPDDFAAHGVELAFLDPELPAYPQDGAGEFVPGLSILDVLLRNPRERVQEMVRMGREAAG